MSPCCAYAVALEAEKTITKPIAISAATVAKSTVSSGVRADPRRVAALCTGRLPKRCDRRRELLASILRRFEHIERRTARREQHDRASVCKLAGTRDCLFHRRGVHGFHAVRGARDLRAGLTDGYQRPRARADRRTHRIECRALG